MAAPLGGKVSAQSNVDFFDPPLYDFFLFQDPYARMLQVSLHSFVTEGGINWGPMMAATVGSLVPAGLIFVLLQRTFVQGVTAGAVKG